jgi:hypothetical protein
MSETFPTNVPLTQIEAPPTGVNPHGGYSWIAYDRLRPLISHYDAGPILVDPKLGRVDVAAAKLLLPVAGWSEVEAIPGEAVAFSSPRGRVRLAFTLDGRPRPQGMSLLRAAEILRQIDAAIAEAVIEIG